MNVIRLYLRRISFCALILLAFPFKGKAQGLYSDNSSIMMLELMRAASAYDDKLFEVMVPVIQDIRDKYNNGQYNECINAVNYTFDNVTFYKRNYYIYSWLYYYRGLSYLKLNFEETGIANLVSAKDAQNEEAMKALEQLFNTHMQKSFNEQIDRNFSSCLYHINLAKSTTFYNYQLYEVEGRALEGMNRFDDAKKSYRLAKKHGSPNAQGLMKQLKKHKKAYMNK